MDPVTLIASAPPEWIPILIILALAFKGWQYWLDKRVIKKAIADELNKDDVTG